MSLACGQFNILVWCPKGNTAPTSQQISLKCHKRTIFIFWIKFWPSALAPSDNPPKARFPPKRSQSSARQFPDIQQSAWRACARKEKSTLLRAHFSCSQKSDIQILLTAASKQCIHPFVGAKRKMRIETKNGFIYEKGKLSISSLSAYALAQPSRRQ